MHNRGTCVYICLCRYVCMHVLKPACMHVSMHACVSLCAYVYLCMYVGVYACIDVSTCVTSLCSGPFYGTYTQELMVES